MTDMTNEAKIFDIHNQMSFRPTSSNNNMKNYNENNNIHNK